MDNELLKEKEAIQNKQHQIDKLEEEHVKFERNAKLFEAQKSNLEQSIAEQKAQIKKLDEEKAKSLTDNEHSQIKIEKLEAKFHKLTNDFDSKTRDFTLMENLKDQFERDNKNLFQKNK